MGNVPPAEERASRATAQAVSETTGTQPPQTVRRTTPADVVGYLVTIAILLFAALEAAQLLGFGFLASLISSFIVAAFQVLVGLVIFGIGLYLSSLAERVIRDSGSSQAYILAPAARIAIIVFSGALALRQMGIADSIVNLAFGLMLGAVAVAAAIAFGLGGRDFAHRQLERWQDSLTTQNFLPNTGGNTENPMSQQSSMNPGGSTTQHNPSTDPGTTDPNNPFVDPLDPDTPKI